MTNLFKIQRYLILFAPISPFFGNGFSEVTIALVGLIFLFSEYKKGFTNKLFSHPIVITFALLCCYLSLRSIFVPEFKFINTLKAALVLRFPLFFIAAVTHIKQDVEFESHYKKALFAGTAFIAANIILQYMTGYNFAFQHIYEGDKHHRYTNLTGKLSAGMSLASFSIPFIYLLSFKIISGRIFSKSNLAKIFSACLIISLIAISGERMAFLMTLFSVGILGVYFIFKRPKIGIISTTFAASLFALLIIFNPEIRARQFEQIMSQIVDFDENTYFRVYNVAFELFKENPTFGTGPKNFRPACVELLERKLSLNVFHQLIDLPGERCPLHQHNIYLEVMSDSGIVGLFFLVVWIYILAKELWLRREIILQNPILFGSASFILIKLFPIIPANSLYIAWAWAPFWFSLAVIISFKKIQKK